MSQKSLFRTILEPFAVAITLAVLARSVVHIYSIPSASMEPTLQPGDQILVTPYFAAKPQRGDVVVFHHNGDLLVKRIVAVPGDLLDARLGRVRIGTHPLPEPYVLRAAATGAIESQIIPADSYYVLGDNRDESMDSRSWGVVPRDGIVGRARLVLWSMTSDGVARASNEMRTTSAQPQSARGRVFKWIE